MVHKVCKDANASCSNDTNTEKGSHKPGTKDVSKAHFGSMVKNVVSNCLKIAQRDPAKEDSSKQRKGFISAKVYTEHYTSGCQETENLKDPIMLMPISYIRRSQEPLWGLFYYDSLDIYDGKPEDIKINESGALTKLLKSSKIDLKYQPKSTNSTPKILYKIPLMRCVAISHFNSMFEIIFSGGSIKCTLRSNRDVLITTNIINAVSAYSASLIHGESAEPIDFKYGHIIKLLTRKITSMSRSYPHMSTTGSLSTLNSIISSFSDVQNSNKNLPILHLPNKKHECASSSISSENIRSIPDLSNSELESILEENASPEERSADQTPQQAQNVDLMYRAILVALSSPEFNWYEMVSIIFLIYRALISVSDVVMCMQKILDIDGLTINAKMMVIWMIYFWIDNFWETDFENGENVMKLGTTLEKMRLACMKHPPCATLESKRKLDTIDLTVPIKLTEILVNAKYRATRLKELDKVDASLEISPDIPEDLKNPNLNFFNIKVKTISAYFTLIDYIHLHLVDVPKFLEYVWGSANDNKGATRSIEDNVHFMYIFQRFNEISLWTATEICSTSKLLLRAKVIRRFIVLAKSLRKLGNYNSMAAVITGLNNNAVKRLKNTWECVGSRQRKCLESLEAVFDPSMNFSNYRAEIKIPVLEVKSLERLKNAIDSVREDHISAKSDVEVCPEASKRDTFNLFSCCLPKKSNNKLFSHKTVHKSKVYCGNAIGGSEIVNEALLEKLSAIPAMFIFAKDLLFSYVGNDISSASKLTKYTEALRVLLNGLQSTSGIVHPKVIEAYLDLELQKQNNYKIQDIVESFSAKSNIEKYAQFVFCMNLFKVNENNIYELSLSIEKDSKKGYKPQSAETESITTSAPSSPMDSSILSSL